MSGGNDWSSNWELEVWITETAFHSQCSCRFPSFSWRTHFLLVVARFSNPRRFRSFFLLSCFTFEFIGDHVVQGVLKMVSPICVCERMFLFFLLLKGWVTRVGNTVSLSSSMLSSQKSSNGVCNNNNNNGSWWTRFFFSPGALQSRLWNVHVLSILRQYLGCLIVVLLLLLGYFVLYLKGLL